MGDMFSRKNAVITFERLLPPTFSCADAEDIEGRGHRRIEKGT
jgi:hypothetical protein